jgi:hypothetical protein
LDKSNAAVQSLIDSAALKREQLRREPLLREQIRANIENFAFTQAVAKAQEALLRANTQVSYADLTRIGATVRNLDATSSLTEKTTNWFDANQVKGFVDSFANILIEAAKTATMRGTLK